MLKPKAVVVSLLVCRLQRRINLSATTKTLLKLFEGKLRLLLRGLDDGDEEGAFVEAQTEVIELLRREYIIGTRYHPLFWLFSQPNGAMVRWAAKRKKALETYRYHYDLSFPELSLHANDNINNGNSTNTSSSLFYIEKRQLAHVLARSSSVEAYEYEPNAAEHERTVRIRTVLEDGHTLSVLEYRVLAFCLDNAHDNRQPVQGLHESLARRCGIRRTLISKAYQTAIRKLVDAAGYFERYLTAHGLTLSRASRRHRAAQRTGHDSTIATTTATAITATTTSAVSSATAWNGDDEGTVLDWAGLHRLREQGVSWPDIGWLLGVNARKLPGLYADYRKR